MPKEWIGSHKKKLDSLCIYCWELNVCTDLYRAKHQFYCQNTRQVSKNPSLDYWKVGKKVLRYLQGTKDHMLAYRRSDHLKVIGYSNSDYVGCVDTRKSSFGYLFILAGDEISWKSVKQSVITASHHGS